jgi:hypothetical protein
MSVVSLSEPVARRLYHDGRDWCLELEAWRAIDRDVFSPSTQVLRGPEVIARALLDLPAYRDLVPRAKAVMQESPAKRTSFLIKPGELSPEPAYSVDRPRSEASRAERNSYVPTAVQHSLADMKNELELLRAQVHELEILIAKFEPQLSTTSNENAHEEAAFDAI